MSAPCLDLQGFTLRTVMPPGDVALVESKAPGFIAAQIAIEQSRLYGRLRKRYATPFGQSAGPLIAVGTSPPGVVLDGVPALGSSLFLIEITGAGALGAAVFRWSSDNGVNWTGPIVSSARVVLGTTGIAATFSPGTYSLDNRYLGSTPVPEIVLGWLTKIVTVTAYRKRGANPQDPQMISIEKDRDEAVAEVKEAADSKEGLFDLPLNENQSGSAVVSGGPLGYSETSPYVWADKQAQTGSSEDQQ